MTYFPDLSFYSYMKTTDEKPDLNVGWLESGHPFPAGEFDPELASALVRCARRPVRLFRGFHECDLCPNTNELTDFPPKVRWKDERPVSVGNGEIRVQGPDGRFYTAPTMVVHYVISHGYIPPKPFSEGVLARAKHIVVLDASEVETIRNMKIPECFELCIDVLGKLHSKFPKAKELEDYIEIVRANYPLAVSGAFRRTKSTFHFTDWAVENFTELPSEFFFIPNFVERLLGHCAHNAEMTDLMRKGLIDFIEQSREHGLE